jgi:copper(I)-binding protein
MKILGFVAIAVLSLAGCHHRQTPAGGVPRISKGIVVSQARLILPVVRGNPGAAYFTLDNQGDAPATLVSIDIAGIKSTEMHETSGSGMRRLASVVIAPGSRVMFAPSGKHVMAFGASPDLIPDGASALTLHFQDGKITSTPLRIEAMSRADASGMAGMTMPMERKN